MGSIGYGDDDGLHYNWGQGAQGAIGGAMTGGMIGGPWGALAGGVAGGVLGGFGSDGASGYEGDLKKLAAGYGNRAAPQMAGYSQFRQNQAGLISQLEAMARGEGPSAAASQMREAMDRAAGAQASAAAGAGGRGVNAGAAMRQAMNNTAAINAQGARDTALARVGEQMGAINQLGSVVGQARSGDESMMRANLEAKLRTMGMNDEGQLKMLLAALGVAGPGTGTQIMAGGANAMPYMAQMFGNSGGGVDRDSLNSAVSATDYKAGY
jgi:hypothetical protein